MCYENKSITETLLVFKRVIYGKNFINLPYLLVDSANIYWTPTICQVLFWVLEIQKWTKSQKFLPSWNLCSSIPLHMHWFARAYISKYHRLDGLNNKSLFFLQFWKWEAQDQGSAELVSSKGPEEGSIPGLSCWLVSGHLLPISLYVSKCPLIRTPVIFN